MKKMRLRLPKQCPNQRVKHGKTCSRKAVNWCFMVIFCLRGAFAGLRGEASLLFAETTYSLHTPRGNDENLTLTTEELLNWIRMNCWFELHCTCKPYESRCQFQVAMVSSWWHAWSLILYIGYSWSCQTCGNTSASHSLREEPSHKKKDL